MTSAWSGHHVVDPFEMEARFSSLQSLSTLDPIFEEINDEESERRIERVREIMEYLPQREADFVDLYYFRGKKQTSIAMIFNVSQPTVHYRLRRATERIQFLLDLPDITEKEMRDTLEQVEELDDPLDIEIMVLMYHTTCQTEAAKHIERSQGFVRHRYLRTMDKMRAAGVLCEDLVELFDMISNRPNIMNRLRQAEDPMMFTVA